jgi:hypothetical protein
MSETREIVVCEEEGNHSTKPGNSVSDWKKLLSMCCKELFEAQQENEKINARLMRALNHIQVSRVYLFQKNS